MPVSAQEGYRLWSASYDGDLNPVLALERRVVSARWHPTPGQRIADIATGTGYWLIYAASFGACGFGVDVSAEMLAQASMKPGLRERLVWGDMTALPLAPSCVDVAICSFALGYVRNIEKLFCELARIARMVIISDLHEEAVNAGWRRGFQAGGQRYEIEHFPHSIEAVDRAAVRCGLSRNWHVAAHLGEAEREIFTRAGRSWAFEKATRIPAIAATCWTRA